MNKTNLDSHGAVAGQVERGVRPGAEAVQPIAYLYHDAATAEVLNVNPMFHSTLLVLAADRRPWARNETPLVTLAQAQAMVAAERERQPAPPPCALTWAIQRLNSTPYAMTKDECVEMLRGLRKEIQALSGPNVRANLTDTAR